MNNNEWELLNPNVISNINLLNNNLVKLMDDMKLLTNENKELKNTVKNLTDQISELKEIKSFLEDNRKKYTKAFDDLNNKINNVMKDNMAVQMNNTKALHNDIESIGEQFTKKLFDPNYRLRMNNIRWRKNNRTVSNYINHES